VGQNRWLFILSKDNTPGCTAQACSFRDQYEDFKDLGAEVIESVVIV
jgi:peroxiredoxin Q/BCP